MAESNDSVELRKEKIKNFLRNNHNLLLFLLVGFTIIFKLYYFFKLGNQPIWWDEGDYLAISKVWAANMPTPEWMAHFTGMRPLFLPLLWSVLFKFGFGELFVRFLTLLIPSIGSVYVLYLLGKDMYNKYTGLIAGLILSTYWVWNFYSFRLLTDIPAVFFGLLSFYFFWSWYELKGRPLGLYLSLLFGVLAFSTRFPYALVPVSFTIYLLITRKLALFKDKTIWKASLIGLIFLLPYLIYLISINFAPLQFYFGDTAISIKQSIQWVLISDVFSFLHGAWFISAIIGLLSIGQLFLGLDIVIKQKDKKLNSDLLLWIWLLIHFIFYVIIIRAGNDRWLLMISVGLFLVASRGIVFVYDSIKKYSHIFAIVLCLGLVFFGAYQNINHSTDLIEGKKTSYVAIKDSGLWLKENTPSDSKIMTPSIVQNQYYSERDSYDLFYNTTLLPNGCIDLYGATVANDSCQKASEDLFNKKISLVNPDYFVISVYEPVFTPQWAYTYAQRNNLPFVKAFFQPENPNQPVLIIYQFPDDFSPIEPGITPIPVTNNTNNVTSNTQKSNSTISNKSNNTK